MGEIIQDIARLERNITYLVNELKKKNCLSQDFNIPTKADEQKTLEIFIDGVISS